MRSLLTVAFLTMSLLSGCSSGSGTIKAKGQLVDAGKPVLPDDNGSIQVIFAPIVESGKEFTTFPAIIDPKDATFTLRGMEGQGIPPGKYRVKLLAMSPKGSNTTTLIQQKFANDKSPLVVEVVDDKLLTIDLAPHKK